MQFCRTSWFELLFLVFFSRWYIFLLLFSFKRRLRPRRGSIKATRFWTLNCQFHLSKIKKKQEKAVISKAASNTWFRIWRLRNMSSLSLSSNLNTTDIDHKSSFTTSTTTSTTTPNTSNTITTTATTAVTTSKSQFIRESQAVIICLSIVRLLTTLDASSKVFPSSHCSSSTTKAPANVTRRLSTLLGACVPLSSVAFVSSQ